MAGPLEALNRSPLTGPSPPGGDNITYPECG